MFPRICIALFVSALAASVSACANSGNPTAVLPLSRERSNAFIAQPLRGVKIREFADLPQYSDYYGPSAIAAGPDGNLWVSDDIDQDFGENVVVGIAPSGEQLHAFYYQGYSSEGASFQDLTAGPDGALWITDEYNEQILRMTLAGKYTSYPLTGSKRAAPFGITVGPDRALWFAAAQGSRGAIGRITTKGRITMYPFSGQPQDIATGSDGALWFTDYGSSAIGRITTHGKITEYSKGITPSSHPFSIAPGPDGALWFTEYTAGRIGRITTSGHVTEYSRGITPTEMPYDIAAGPDGAMWFTESEYYNANGKIARISMKGSVSEYSNGLTLGSDPTCIVAGPDNKMWFVESAADKTGRLTL